MICLFLNLSDALAAFLSNLNIFELFRLKGINREWRRLLLTESDIKRSLCKTVNENKNDIFCKMINKLLMDYNNFIDLDTSEKLVLTEKNVSSIIVLLRDTSLTINDWINMLEYDYYIYIEGGDFEKYNKHIRKLYFAQDFSSNSNRLKFVIINNETIKISIIKVENLPIDHDNDTPEEIDIWDILYDRALLIDIMTDSLLKHLSIHSFDEYNEILRLWNILKIKRVDNW